jgi:hypothetical protein
MLILTGNADSASSLDDFSHFIVQQQKVSCGKELKRENNFTVPKRQIEVWGAPRGGSREDLDRGGDPIDFLTASLTF